MSRRTRAQARRLCAFLALHRPWTARRRFWIAFGLFLLAFGARSLHAIDLAPLLLKQQQPGSRMMHRHDEVVAHLLRGEGVLFARPHDPRDTGLLARPPGYPLFLAAVYRVLGRTFWGAQLVQNILNSFTPCLLFWLGVRLVGDRAAAIGGGLAAVSVQYAHHSNRLTPDMLCVLPVVAALLVLVRARNEPPLWPGALAGVLLGAATWLRPNMLLLGPFCAVVFFLASRRRRTEALRFGLMAAVSLAAIAPITIRNYVFYGAFVPMSINGGLVLWEGVADASGSGFGSARTDGEVAAREAQEHGEPRYAEWWASPDGIQRDRERMRRSLAVIRAHPLWFFGTMLWRMGQMLDHDYERPPLLTARPPALDDLREIGFGRVAGQRYGAELAALMPRVSAQTCLLPGRILAFLRLPLRVLEAGVQTLLLPLLVIGVAGMLILSAPRALFLLAVPGYYLVLQSPLHFEYRFALPMQAPLYLLAGLTAAAGLGWVAEVTSRPKKT